MTVWIGTSGWQYADWRGRFYPAGVPQRRWFEHTLAAFRTVELNVTFYRLPKREVFSGWRERSPGDAVLTVKASRYLTHVKRLREPEEPVARLLHRAAGLGDKLGPVLVQLPPDLQAAPEALARTLACFPPSVRVAVEPRHASWWTTEVREVLTAYGAALCWADRRDTALTPLWRSAGWGYLRLHESSTPPWPLYRPEALARWAERLAGTWRDDEDVYVYLNNDPGCAAVDNAVTLAEEVRRLGRTATRVPERPPYVCEPLPV